MAGQENSLSGRLQERLYTFRQHIEESCQALFADLKHETTGYAYELEKRSKELDAKAEQLTQRETACEQLVEKLRASSDGSASHKQDVEKRSIGIQAGQQSASYDARKMYGDLTTGDITHQDVRLAFVEYFGKHRRSYSAIFLGGRSFPVSCAPCYIFQAAYEQAKEYVLVHLLAELMKLFRSKKLDDADNLADRERALIMLLENTRTTPECQDVAVLLSQPHVQQTLSGTLSRDAKQKLEEQARKLMKKELCQLFTAETHPHSKDEKVWENRRRSFGLLLHITGIKQTQPYNDLKQAVLPRLKKYQSKFGTLFAEVPSLIEESVKIVWDMVTLNPPAISTLPRAFNEDWHEKHVTQWEEGRESYRLVYYNPVLFFSFSMDVAHKAEVGNKPLGSASSNSDGHARSTRVAESTSSGVTFVKRVCSYCDEETKAGDIVEIREGEPVCQQCYQKFVLPGLINCHFCQRNIESMGGGYYLEGNTSMICKYCYSDRFLVCRKCKRNFRGGNLSVHAVGYSWHSACLTCYYCKMIITGNAYPHPQYPQEPVCHDCLKP